MSDTDNKPKAARRAQDLTATDRASIVRQLEFGASLSDQTVSQFAESSVVLDVRRRRFVYRAGDQADALYAIVRGRIKLCRIEPQTDREAVIDILPEGALFGESALYSKAGRRQNCAVAYESCTLLRIPSDQFRIGMAAEPLLHEYTFQLIGERLEHAEQRLADFSDRYGVRESTGVLIDIPLPHREIASIVGSTRESVTVRLNAMRREGTIEFVNRRILVKRPEGLLHTITEVTVTS
jgi:CRP-like cAMP-binding protein